MSNVPRRTKKENERIRKIILIYEDDARQHSIYLE